ncbi:FkbM family methyltransferase [Agrobacterium larrymoorei]|uniref:FkbM family methyltransferase n=1 Tax=Agrobacterium larrymoorei TaxID=160699 RepID=A0AAF0KEN8_9HYPH|nr:FkbM family methyltransferase [Agrobacterium larrymoorei]WHA42580.1 FkbM family methyltransferase [Agrobacterium larrymoorei]
MAQTQAQSPVGAHQETNGKMSNNKVKITLTDLNDDLSPVTFEIDKPTDLIQAKISSTNDFYERPLLDIVGSITPADSVFLDVGANIGNHTLFMAAKTRAKVLSFEPNKDNFGRLIKNIELSKMTGSVEAFNVAVGKQAGVVRSIFSSQKNTGGAKVQSTNKDDELGVPLIKIDDFLKKIKLKFTGKLIIKIDVEGMEVEVIEGMTSTIEEYQPIIVCEASSDKNIVLLRNIPMKRGYIVAASFFKSPTFLMVHKDNASSVFPHILEHSWSSARSYVSYCELSKMKVRAQKAIADAAEILK